MVADITAALAEPLGKRHKTRFASPGSLSNSGWKDVGDKALAEHRQRQKTLKLAEQIGGRDTSREVVEHIPAGPVYVSPQRAAELQNRTWIGPTQTNRITGAVSHMRRVRKLGGGFETIRVEGPAP